MILLLVVIPVAVGLLANQLDALGAWIAVPIARWAAYVRYADNPDRAAERAQDWAAQIEQSIPGSLFKLGFAIGMAGRGMAAATARTSRQAASLSAGPGGVAFAAPAGPGGVSFAAPAGPGGVAFAAPAGSYPRPRLS